MQPLTPGPAAEMTIAGANTITIADVLVGDVWLGSGQSNMQWAVRQADNAEAETASAKCPQIRLFYVPRKPSSVPVEDVAARWIVCSPESIAEFSAVLYYFGRQMHQDVKVPMGLIHSSWGGTPIASWISGPSLVGDPRLEPFLTYWQNVILQYPVNASRYEQNLQKWEAGGSQGPRPAAPMGPGHAHEPTTLYNGMIAPLVKYTIKGALWYQGETEAGRAQGQVYGAAMMTLVQDWRRAFGQGDFPFYWVQLANYGNAVKNGHWMRVQEGQVKATALRNTGVAVITDIGNPTNIHPTNKQEVGRRLAMLAQNKGASPLYRQYTREGSAMRIWFDHAGKGLKTRGDGPVTGFAIAGADGKYVPAIATIEGATGTGLQPGRAESAVGAIRVGLQPGSEPDQCPDAAGVAVSDRRERRASALTAITVGSAPPHPRPRRAALFARGRVLPEQRQQIRGAGWRIRLGVDDFRITDRLAVHLRVLIEILAQRGTRKGDAGEDSPCA